MQKKKFKKNFKEKEKKLFYKVVLYFFPMFCFIDFIFLKQIAIKKATLNFKEQRKMRHSIFLMMQHRRKKKYFENNLKYETNGKNSIRSFQPFKKRKIFLHSCYINFRIHF